MIVLNWGRTSYAQAWDFQLSFIKSRRQQRLQEDALVLLEHHPVITVGRKGQDSNILVNETVLKQRNCEVFHIDRGGDVTYHGPGQLVGYPLLDLRRYGQDVHAYVEKLEEVIICTLADFGITAGREEQYTGVWVGNEKICAIGIGMKSWLSYHGFALNIDTDLADFRLITPCGISDKGVTSMKKLLGSAPDQQKVRERLIAHFMDIFGVKTWETLDGTLEGESQRPSWLKGHMSGNLNVKEVYGMLDELSLTTVCSGAHCPNIGECYASRTATFMIMGSQCTRRCRFCAVPKGQVLPLDIKEPQRVAEMVHRLGLKYAVITSVTRDDLPDGGARHFAETIQAIRRLAPDTVIEVLIPDLQGVEAALDVIIAAEPEVINHNLETIAPLYPQVRPQADYQRSLQVIAYVKGKAPHILTKSGLMVGLGENSLQVAAALADLRSAGCDLLTIGQYLAPSAEHVPVKEYIIPGQFDFYRKLARALGFIYAACDSLVRSSYRAAEGFQQNRSCAGSQVR